MTHTYNWTTARGAKISATITVTHITRDTAYADGFNIEVSADRWERTVDSMTVNGKPTKLRELYNERGTKCILSDRIGKDRILVALPSDVEEAIYGEERLESARKLDAAIKAEKEYDAHVAAVCKMMDERKV